MDFSKPSVIFILVWMVAIILHLLKLTNNIVDPNLMTLVLLLSCLIVMLVLMSGVDSQKEGLESILKNMIERKSSARFEKMLFLFWIIGTLIDISYSGGVPIIWMIMLNGKDYTQFGVPSFHGLVNAAYLFLTTYLFLKYLLTENKKILFYFILMMCWPVAMLGRGILLGAVMQSLAVYLLIRRLRFDNIALIVIFGLFFIVLFGFLGNFRSDGNVLSYLIPVNGFIGNLPDGFLWVYVYITAGLNNIYFSYPLIDSIGYPFYSVLNLIPSVLKNYLGNFTLNESLVLLVDENLNTSTYLAGFISDFGFLGGIWGTAILALASRLTYVNAKSGNLGSVIAYSVIYQCLIFSPFYDMFFLLPTLFQLFLAKIYTIQSNKDCNE